ncbi:WD40 repeat domain-containing protein [Leptothoe spongobia]|uniref:WD40 repeat domain-containing protein n=1 Tax=Leptothoe spongobia TAU-MAC 1115 TaxID=1967444 RepID=A0A947DI81_9CYAN|nr:WD40 repeat domain-containing protein [Leptothoe spongobia]MBT9317677.1 WD40 repeat domain-containing protein [Leptothoe spongobia TAU-MAC 1115]
MSNHTSSSITKKENEAYPSLASLRTAHSELLKRYRQQENKNDALASIEQLIYGGRATGVLLDHEDDRWAAQSILDYWHSTLYRIGIEAPDATLEDFDPEQAPTLEESQCPYLGLEAFRESNKDLFYGRQKILGRLLKQLCDHRLVTIVGASGSGKSSLVLGGLIPQLKTGAIPGSEQWYYLGSMVPGSQPLQNLAQLLRTNNVGSKQDMPQKNESLRTDPEYLSSLITDLSGGQTAVLVVDQFEEVFTLCLDEAERDAFIDSLMSLSQDSESTHRVILTMRTDFESQVATIPDFKSVFERAQIRVTALDVSELRDAIEKPAGQVGLKFEDGVIEALLSDVLGEPAALPLLQFTLLKLWNNRSRNRITWEAYQRLGGGRLALANSADDFYDALIPEDQITVRRILLKMIRLTEGMEVTSNRIRKQSLYQSGEAKDRIDRVLEKLIQERLVRLTGEGNLDDTQVEVAHEALIRNWPRLVSWLEEERNTLRQRLRLTIAAEQWQAKGRERSVLLRGSLLDDAQHYQNLSDIEDEFVRCSTQSEKRLKRRQFSLTATALIVLGALNIFAISQARLAEARRLLAEQRLTEVELLQKADEVTQLSKIVPEEALALAIQVTGQSQEKLGRVPAAIQDSLQKALEVALANGQDVKNTSTTFSPDGQLIASTGSDGTVKLWDSEGVLVSSYYVISKGLISTAVFSPDGQFLATGDSNGTIKIWSIDGKEATTLEGYIGQINDVEFSPNGEFIASAYSDGTVQLWTLGGKRILSYAVSQGSVSNVVFSPDGKFLATAGSDGTVKLWNLEGELVSSLFVSDSSVSSVVFSPDGKFLATAGSDGIARLWSTNGNLLTEFPQHTDLILDVAFSPDGEFLATSSLDGTINLWDLEGGQLLQSIRNHAGISPSVSFSSDAQTLLGSGRDGTIRIWDLEGNLTEEFSEIGNWKTLLRFACDGLRDSPILNESENTTAQEAADICWKESGIQIFSD